MTAITLNQAANDLMVNLDRDIPTILVGPVGVGKTDVVRQCAERLRSSAYGGLRVLVIDKRASQMEPTDLAVPMPDIATRRVVACLQEWLPDSIQAAQYDMIILLLDELSDAQIGTQAALNQLVLERELPGYKLPANVRIVATGNSQSDRAAAQKFSRATSNRFAIIEIMVDVKSFIEWSIANGLSPVLIAYVQNADRQGVGAQALHRYPASGSDAIAFMTPRSFARCDRYLKMSTVPNDAQLRRLFAQNIGEDSANDLMNFMATYRLAPNLDAVIADPINTPIPREPSVNYVITVGLVSRLTLANLSKIGVYVKRMDTLYQAAFWNMAIAKDESFRMTAEHTSFAINQSQEAA